MEYGLIADTTLTSMADALRAKGIASETRTDLIDCVKYKSDKATSLDDPTPTGPISMTESKVINLDKTCLEEFVINLAASRPASEFQ